MANQGSVAEITSVIQETDFRGEPWVSGGKGNFDLFWNCCESGKEHSHRVASEKEGIDHAPVGAHPSYSVQYW